MQRLNSIYLHLLEEVSLDFTRYIYSEINWNNRLLLLKGSKGVGKTTMLLQHIKRTFPDVTKAFYASADNSWFTTHTMVDLAEYLVSHGVTHLFLDEVHKYINWDREIKEIYDSFPKLNIVITGSSMLQLTQTEADLSRRCRSYTLQGLSFREYLAMEGVLTLSALSLEEILSTHTVLAARIKSQIPVLKHFENYLHCGYYPFYKEEGDGFHQRLENVINTIIQVEMPSVEKVSYELVYKIKILLGILAEEKPFTLNVSHLATKLESSRDSIYRMFDLLQKAALIRRLYENSSNMKMLQKPEKILFDNTNLMYALSPEAEIGTVRETFVTSMLFNHKISMPAKGDVLVDDKYLLEVGGKKKKFAQIADVSDSYVVADNIEVGIGNRIPLWIFGLLY